MIRVLDLLRKTTYTILFVISITQILIFELYLERLTKLLKVELIWRFLVSFGALS